MTEPDSQNYDKGSNKESAEYWRDQVLAGYIFGKVGDAKNNKSVGFHAYEKVIGDWLENWEPIGNIRTTKDWTDLDYSINPLNPFYIETMKETHRGVRKDDESRFPKANYLLARTPVDVSLMSFSYVMHGLRVADDRDGLTDMVFNFYMTNEDGEEFLDAVNSNPDLIEGIFEMTYGKVFDDFWLSRVSVSELVIREYSPAEVAYQKTLDQQERDRAIREEPPINELKLRFSKPIKR